MIQPQELRIGNLLYFKRFPNVPESFEVIKVTSISKNGFISFVNSDGEKENYFIDCFEPIKITEEILLRFYIKKGFNEIFKQQNAFGKKVLVEIEFNGINDIAIWTSEFNDDDNDYSLCNNFNLDLKFAHQLQNLYFALKGEELQFK